MKWKHNARGRLQLVWKQQIRTGNKISRTEILRGKKSGIKGNVKLKPRKW
jgi:hypothetical protein